MAKGYRQTIRVFCSKCHLWHDEQKVEYLGFEADFQGYDILTFKCPKCGHKTKSKRVG